MKLFSLQTGLAVSLIGATDSSGMCDTPYTVEEVSDDSKNVSVLPADVMITWDNESCQVTTVSPKSSTSEVKSRWSISEWRVTRRVEYNIPSLINNFPSIIFLITLPQQYFQLFSFNWITSPASREVILYPQNLT